MSNDKSFIQQIRDAAKSQNAPFLKLSRDEVDRINNGEVLVKEVTVKYLIRKKSDVFQVYTKDDLIIEKAGVK